MPRGPGAAIGRLLFTNAALLLPAISTACAYSYTEADGTRRIIGFVDVEVRPPADERAIAGQVIDVRTIGLSLLEAQEATSIALGWQRHIAAALRDNALVLGNPLEAMADSDVSDSNRGSSDEK